MGCVWCYGGGKGKWGKCPLTAIDCCSQRKFHDIASRRGSNGSRIGFEGGSMAPALPTLAPPPQCTSPPTPEAAHRTTTSPHLCVLPCGSQFANAKSAPLPLRLRVRVEGEGGCMATALPILAPLLPCSSSPTPRCSPHHHLTAFLPSRAVRNSQFEIHPFALAVEGQG